MQWLAALAGVVSPLVFGLVVLTLTILQYPFMRSLGWDLVLHPTFDWPSGLALGPIGWIMTLTFLLCGASMSFFALGLRGALSNRTGRMGSSLLAGAGVAMMGLAFSTDRTISALPITWHGRLHDLSFLALGLLIIPAMVLLALSFREYADWKQLSPFTWVAFALAIPTFAFKGIVFYAFLTAMLVWNVWAAYRLWRHSG